MNKIATGILACLCFASVSLANQPTDKATSFENNPKKSDRSKSSSMEAVYFFLKGEYADVESGKTVVYSSLVTVSRWEWENKKDEILESFEETLYKAYPRKTVSVGYESVSKHFSEKHTAKEVLDSQIIKTLDQRFNAQFLYFRY